MKDMMGTVNERISQQQHWTPVQSHNQFEEKLEQFSSKFRQEFEQQKREVVGELEKSLAEVTKA